MKKLIILALFLIMPVFIFTLTSCTDDKGTTTAGQGSISSDVKEGERVYEDKCLKCHGEGGQGGICPNLVDDEWKYGDTDEEIYKSIAEGRPGGMPDWENSLGDKKIKNLVAYIRSLKTE